MFHVETGSYSAPVTTYDDLARCLPGDYAPSEPLSHVVNIKTCNAPELLTRCISSLQDEISLDHVQPIVVDDSKKTSLREQNITIAQNNGAEYCAVGGNNSLVDSLVKYIEATESCDSAATLVPYLERIATDYPTQPSSENWGGVGGAQNVGHLRSAMHFGALQLPQTEWLSTFIDDDVLMPPNAEEIFRMIGVYHGLGSVSVVAANYLHHSGNPIILADNAIKELSIRSVAMDQAAIETEVSNILRRTPTMGLRQGFKSYARYSTPEQMLVFPGGNYSLTGGEAFQVPVPIVGIEDLGYAAMLQLFKGAKELGVARVPDFVHKRYNRTSGGDVHGDLHAFCKAEKDVDYNSFQLIAREYAKDIGVPSQNVETFVAQEAERGEAQIRLQESLIRQLQTLRDDARFTNVSDTLAGLQQSVEAFAHTKAEFANVLTLDRRFVKSLLTDMLALHPQLITKAYDFGRDGELAAYNHRIKTGLESTLVA